MRRAKIVCTMGPAVESPEKVRELIAAGMNMARLNLSHGSYEEHQGRLDRVREAAKEAGKAVAILVDLQGPKIRLARFENGPHELARGDIFTITTDEVPGTKERVGTTYKGLPGDCKPGDFIMIDDGKVTVDIDTSAVPTAYALETLIKGEGEVVADGATVVVNYHGVNMNTGVVFDSSFDRGTPATFNVNQVIQGFHDAIVGQAIGSRVVVIVPADLGYGDAGSGENIAGGDTIMFVIDILGLG